MFIGAWCSVFGRARRGLAVGFLSSGVSVVSCCRGLVVVSSPWFVGGLVEGGGGFLRAGQIMCLSRGRSKG